MACAFKNLAIVHQQYFNDPVGGYPKGYGYYGDQFAVNFIRHLKGNAARYRLDVQRICCFGHSKGSQTPGMLLNKLRGAPPYRTAKADWSRTGLSDVERTIPSPFSHLSTEIAGAVLGAGIANSELGNDKLTPWDNEPVKNISPFFLYADHRADTRRATSNTVAKARARGVDVETAELSGHTWPCGEAYDRASAFIDRILRLDP
jgi:acetyl esterase/lipase